MLNNKEKELNFSNNHSSQNRVKQMAPAHFGTFLVLYLAKTKLLSKKYIFLCVLFTLDIDILYKP